MQITSKKEQQQHMNIAVVGSGLMGRGIGQSFATAGHTITLVDISQNVLQRALEQTQSILTDLTNRDVAMDSPDEILGRMKTEMDTAKATRNADFVVEAVVENLDTKKEVFSILSKSTPKECIIASNTSSLPISALASATSKPDLVVGTHFWNPPHLVQAVEVVRGEKTSDETVERTVSMLKKIGKKPAVVQKDVPGQIGIRILYAMIREATSLVEKGVATPEDVDTIVREALGTRLEVVGPLELADLSGVDLVNAVAKTVYKTLDSSHGPQPLIQKMVQEGTLGIKSGKGFYDWKTHDPQDLIKKRDEHLIEILRERQRMV